MLLGKSEESSCKVDLIGTIQRLGISYHFEEEIRSILSSISMETANDWHVDGVASVALKFRLLRENGFSADPGTENHYCIRLMNLHISKFRIVVSQSFFPLFDH